jgi:hypothetical protein
MDHACKGASGIRSSAESDDEYLIAVLMIAHQKAIAVADMIHQQPGDG